MKEFIRNNLKNIYGWKTDRKVIVFAVDDYGNVRVHSKKARESMSNSGLKIYSRFDAYDSIENTEDLEMLFETLTSVKDCNGRNAIFSVYAMPCNINFEKVIENNFDKYYYELLPETFNKLESRDVTYKNTWDLWIEGMNNNILAPQFHGREHLNIKVFNEKLKNRDEDIIIALKNRSYTSLKARPNQRVKYTAAFDFWDPEENQFFKKILLSGIENFKKVFGQSPHIFMPPRSSLHQSHHQFLKAQGINFLESAFITKQHLGFGKHKKIYNYTGKKLKNGPKVLMRNVVFEPTSSNIDWINYTMNQIETAFYWKKPAVISSHRINFSGNIDKKNRSKGIADLRNLLNMIIDRWPDVEFMSSKELSYLIAMN